MLVYDKRFGFVLYNVNNMSRFHKMTYKTILIHQFLYINGILLFIYAHGFSIKKFKITIFLIR